MSAEATHIRSMHWAAFRSGEWAQLLTTAPNPEGSDCYVIRFSDGATDYWVVEDPDGQYEFAATRPGSEPPQTDSGGEGL